VSPRKNYLGLYTLEVWLAGTEHSHHRTYYVISTSTKYVRSGSGLPLFGLRRLYETTMPYDQPWSCKNSAPFLNILMADSKQDKLCQPTPTFFPSLLSHVSMYSAGGVQTTKCT
jgi:hypothetical protein